MKTAAPIVTALLLLSGMLLSGCSKTDEMTDNAASNLVSRIKTPIEDARAVSEKAAKTREVELPK